MNHGASDRIEQRLQMRMQARRAAQTLGILADSAPVPMRFRRRAGLPGVDSRMWLSLVEDDGVWRLREDGASSAVSMGRRGRRFRGAAAGGDAADDGALIPLERLRKDEVRAALTKLDLKLTPQRGLRPLDLERVTLGAPIEHPAVRAQRVLVMVHGTFSESQAMIDGLRRSPDHGDALFRALGKRYDQVLAFDHPTLTVDPIVNARELALALEPCAATVDLVAHSRGGLVARWWADAFDKGAARPGRVVYVGSPLAGTGLAAAPNLRKTLDLMANVSAGLGWASAGIPLLQAAVGMFHAFSSAVRFASGAPVPDVLIGLVPGLRAMSRIENNAELLALRKRASSPGPDRFFVRANFEPDAVGWKFWKLFRAPQQRLADAGADVIFDGDNDLVVDTPSMADWIGPSARVAKNNLLDFPDRKTVHHLNYFEQTKTTEFLADVLCRP